MRSTQTTNDLRIAIMATIDGVLDGKVGVPQANAIANLSEQFHKSIDQEWEMRVYAERNFALSAPSVIELIGGGQ